MSAAPDRCAACGLRYCDLRTGLDFGDVRRLLRSMERRWVRRRAVLGYWHELKLGLWRYHLDECSP